MYKYKNGKPIPIYFDDERQNLLFLYRLKMQGVKSLNKKIKEGIIEDKLIETTEKRILELYNELSDIADILVDKNWL